MKYLLAKKQEMTQLYSPSGDVVAVTVAKAEPNYITRVKTKETDGYESVQVATGVTKKLAKPQAEFLKKLGLPMVRIAKEVRLNTRHGKRSWDIKQGDSFSVDQFAPGDRVVVRGITKGKGFQGVVKRHGFSGGPASHGHKDQERMPGSIGSTGPQEVFKGRKMPGRMGGDQVTIRGLEVVKVDTEKNCVYIKGAIPGARNSWIEIIQE